MMKLTDTETTLSIEESFIEDILNITIEEYELLRKNKIEMRVDCIETTPNHYEMKDTSPPEKFHFITLHRRLKKSHLCFTLMFVWVILKVSRYSQSSKKK